MYKIFPNIKTYNATLIATYLAEYIRSYTLKLLVHWVSSFTEFVSGTQGAVVRRLPVVFFKKQTCKTTDCSRGVVELSACCEAMAYCKAIQRVVALWQLVSKLPLPQCHITMPTALPSPHTSCSAQTLRRVSSLLKVFRYAPQKS